MSQTRNPKDHGTPHPMETPQTPQTPQTPSKSSDPRESYRGSKVLQSGIKAQCQVLIKSSGLQCSNPWNAKWHGHGVCSGTHLGKILRLESAGTPSALAALKAMRFCTVVQAYDSTLWGISQTPSKAPQTPSKAPSKASKDSTGSKASKASKAPSKAPAVPNLEDWPITETPIPQGLSKAPTASMAAPLPPSPKG